jgi:hypothetical protein
MILPEHARDVLNEVDQDFSDVHFIYELPHRWTIDEYSERYEDLEHQIIEIVAWRIRWFGKKNTESKEQIKQYHLSFSMILCLNIRYLSRLGKLFYLFCLSLRLLL